MRGKRPSLLHWKTVLITSNGGPALVSSFSFQEVMAIVVLSILLDEASTLLPRLKKTPRMSPRMVPSLAMSISIQAPLFRTATFTGILYPEKALVTSKVHAAGGRPPNDDFGTEGIAEIDGFVDTNGEDDGFFDGTTETDGMADNDGGDDGFNEGLEETDGMEETDG